MKGRWNESESTRFIEGFIEGAEWMEQNRWVPTRERLPEDEGEYMVTRKRISSVVGASFESGEFGYYDYDLEEFVALDDVIAWLPNPAPYCPF